MENCNQMKCEKQSLYNPLPPVSTLLHKTELVSSSALLLAGSNLELETCKKLRIEPDEYRLTKKQKELRLKQSVNKLAKCLKIS